LTAARSTGTLMCMPRTAYLDANVYNDIERKAVPVDDVEATRAARNSGALIIRLGICDLEESALAVWEKDLPLALRRLAIMRELAGFDNLLKQPSDVLDMAIRVYATGGLQPSPLLPPAQRLDIANRIAEGIGNPTAFAPVVKDIIRGIEEQKESTRRMLADGQERSLIQLKEKFGRRDLRKLSFEEFFEVAALGWAEDFARSLGLADACRERGLDKMLEVPTVRLTVGKVLSLIHALTVAERKPRGSDAYDVWHAIQASTADVFVTNDDRFHEHMTRIPGVTSVRTVKSLRELLDTIG